MTERRIGVYICYCGGNISDYVDCEHVREAIKDEENVVLAKTAMFTCSDATQQEMIDDINEHKLDGLVVASCSPMLHLFTFRGVAKRAGLNPYLYIQVNLREQCSWAHTDNNENATEKAIRMVRGGIAKARYTKPLKEIRIETVPRALVIGAGVAGLRAALALSDLGISVYITEKSERVGGWVGTFKRLYPHERTGNQLIADMVETIKSRDNITIYNNAELIEKSGSVGDFTVKLRLKDEDHVTLNVGSIIVCTGFKTYTPVQGEFAFGQDGLLTLPEFKTILDEQQDGPIRGVQGGDRLEIGNKPVKEIAYIYCVGSRDPTGENGHSYCSRFCCNAAVHTSSVAYDVYPDVHQFHLFRDMRTYGKFELLYEESRQKGARFIKFDDNEPPQIEKSNGKFTIKVKDVLTANEELELDPDLVVLVTAMEPCKNDELNDVLKVPVGLDGFYKESHPKLKPVETVIDGVFVAGTSQGPRNSAESVASALAASAKSAALLKKGYVELEPLIAMVNKEQCTWCDVCTETCPYSAITRIEFEGKEIAEISEALCKGCGGCVPLCPNGAIDVKGFTDQQIKATIHNLARSV